MQRDLEKLSYKISRLIFWPLNEKKKAAVLSYAFSIGFPAFKNCELLDIINKVLKEKKLLRFGLLILIKNGFTMERHLLINVDQN